MIYDNFSEYYDLFTKNVDYKKTADYLIKVFKKYSSDPKLLLDLGCGTGNISLLLSDKKREVIGVDPSGEMLNVASKKAEEKGKNILFLQQSGKDLDLYGTVDGAVAVLDTVNHITSYSELKKTFSKVSLFLEPSKLFIFDVNTLYKHERVLGDNSFVYENDGTVCVWQNGYNKRKRTTDIKIDFFKKENDKYIRKTETFSERCYSDEELTLAAEKSGFIVEHIFKENTFLPPDSATERKVFVLRKVK